MPWKFIANKLGQVRLEEAVRQNFVFDLTGQTKD